MKYNPEIHHRQSIRLKGYDYSQNGIYFVTICTQNREHLFGEIMDGEMHLNEAGKMIQLIWDEIPKFYSWFEIDAFQIMPNHIHGIIMIQNESSVGAGPRACPDTTPRACPDDKCACPDNWSLNLNSGWPDNSGQLPDNSGRPQGVAPMKILSLSDIVHRFKTMSTNRYTNGVKNDNWQPFGGKLWQRNYYEHIIRDEISLEKICTYIIDNPRNWDMDDMNETVTT